MNEERAYIGTDPKCGCIVSLYVVEPPYRMSKHVKQDARDGLAVSLVTVEYAKGTMNAKRHMSKACGRP